MSPDFPTDACSVDQEKGRIGRRFGASTATDHYVICGSLQSFAVQLVGRLYLPEEIDQTNADSAMGIDDYRKHCVDELLDVLDLFVLANDCLHSLLAYRLANPYLPASDVALPPCPTDAPQCSYCNGALASQFPKLVKAGVQTVLFDVFLVLGISIRRSILHFDGEQESVEIVLVGRESTRWSREHSSVERVLLGRESTTRSREYYLVERVLLGQESTTWSREYYSVERVLLGRDSATRSRQYYSVERVLGRESTGVVGQEHQSVEKVLCRSREH